LKQQNGVVAAPKRLFQTTLGKKQKKKTDPCPSPFLLFFWSPFAYRPPAVLCRAASFFPRLSLFFFFPYFVSPPQKPPLLFNSRPPLPLQKIKKKNTKTPPLPPITTQTKFPGRPVFLFLLFFPRQTFFPPPPTPKILVVFSLYPPKPEKFRSPPGGVFPPPKPPGKSRPRWPFCGGGGTTHFPGSPRPFAPPPRHHRHLPEAQSLLFRPRKEKKRGPAVFPPTPLAS